MWGRMLDLVGSLGSRDFGDRKGKPVALGIANGALLGREWRSSSICICTSYQLSKIASTYGHLSSTNLCSSNTC